MVIFLLNFLSRIILAPLLPAIEQNLQISHGQAGSFFMMISIGYCGALLGSGFISSRTTHRNTIVLSSIITGLALSGVAISHSLFQIRGALLLLGIAAGMYLPSGLATLTDLSDYRHWGKTIAIHELAPSLAFLFAPLISEAFLKCCSWKGVLLSIGAASILVGVLFAFFMRGGKFTGGAPNLRNTRVLLTTPAFWVMTILFSLAIAASIGIYSMLPLYLVSEREIERTVANTFIAMSRIPVLFTALFAGWLSDRVGPRPMITCVLIFNGIMTILLGVMKGKWLFGGVLLQPMLSVCFFPAAFTLLATISPAHTRNLAVSFTIFFAYLIGAGAIPLLMGTLGERHLFALAFIIVGGCILLSVSAVRFLENPKHKP